MIPRNARLIPRNWLEAFPGIVCEFPGIGWKHSRESCANSQELVRSIPGNVVLIPRNWLEAFPGMRIQSTRNELVVFPGMKCKIPGTSQTHSRE